MYMYMYMSSWLTIGIHVHVPCRGSFGFTAGKADQPAPPATDLQNSTYPKVSATLASHRPGYRRKAIERRKQHPEPGLATEKQDLPEGSSHPCQPPTCKTAPT